MLGLDFHVKHLYILDFSDLSRINTSEVLLSPIQHKYRGLGEQSHKDRFSELAQCMP